MNKTLIIFDCDGTLVDSEGIANEVFIEAVKDLGIPLTEEEAWEHFPGTSLALCMEYVEQTYQTRLPSNFVEMQRKRQRIVFAEKLQPIKGVRSVLEALQFDRCVASNGPEDIVRQNLITTGLSDFFNGDIFSAYTIGKWKPEPHLFLHAAETMDFSPENCIVIEDSEAGIQAALNANMKVVAYQPPSMHYKPSAHPTASFSIMKDLPDILNYLS